MTSMLGHSLLFAWCASSDVSIRIRIITNDHYNMVPSGYNQFPTGPLRSCIPGFIYIIRPNNAACK